MEKKLLVKSPYDGELLGELEYATAEEVEAFLCRAETIAQNKGHDLNADARKDILNKASKIVADNLESFARQAAEEGGKPIVDSRVEIARAAKGLKIAAESIDRLTGRQIPMNLPAKQSERIAYTFMEPSGVVLGISAFNHPFNLIVHQVAPAIACGCPVIIKPDSRTPLSCSSLLQVLYDAGLPKNWTQMLIVDNNLAESIATDRRLAFVSFIGSSRVGWKLRSKLSPGTRCALEHGGAAPVIIADDADLEKAIPLLTKGAFYHAGQVCVSVQKVFVTNKLIRKFIQQFEKSVKDLKTGNPLNETTDVGPLIQESEVQRVEEWVENAVTEGAKLVCGGDRIAHNFYKPTILLNPKDSSFVSCKEIFGPVVCVYAINSIEEAISRANALPFIFQGSVFTKDISQALQVVQNLNAKAVMVNDHTAFRVDWMPFGGAGESGLGTGGIFSSMLDMSREKLWVLNKT